ncbi:MAG: hypothetical protein D084_Lepto4C00679G0002 [Leptospirillum sp. Group IV 'UBA BS']|nr:MAG: hypothetical protein D084_Lepto4C00679G0002 [Leptospirillum sp. Group IV 'UBA BS']
MEPLRTCFVVRFHPDTALSLALAVNQGNLNRRGEQSFSEIPVNAHIRRPGFRSRQTL